MLLVVEHWHARFPASALAIQAIRGEMGAVARTCGLPDGRVKDVQLAVSEVATNVVQHAYPEDAPGMIDVNAWTDSGQLRISISDDGCGMLPRPDSAGIGLGLPLIATLAESLELGTGANEETEVRMSFRLDAVTGDELRPR